MKQTSRKTYLDVLRILANFLVIFNHTSGYYLYQNATYISKWKGVAYVAISLFTKINIPLFFMITGVLLLGKEEPLNVVLKKRVLRFAILLLGANTLMYFVRTPFHELNFQKWLSACLNCTAEGSYWYLYTHLAFLIMLPYIRKMVINFTKKDFGYFLAIHCIVATILPIVDYFVYVGTGNHVNVFPELTALIMVYQSFFYPIVGYYIDKHFDGTSLNFKTLLPLYGVCAVGIGVVSYLTYNQGIRFGYTEDFFKLFDYVLAITTFLTMKYVFSKKEASQKHSFGTATIATIAPLTLGIYILEPALKICLQESLNMTLAFLTPKLLISFAWCFLSMLICGLFTFVLRLIPGVKKIL